MECYFGKSLGVSYKGVKFKKTRKDCDLSFILHHTPLAFLLTQPGHNFVPEAAFKVQCGDLEPFSGSRGCFLPSWLLGDLAPVLPCWCEFLNNTALIVKANKAQA